MSVRLSYFHYYFPRVLGSLISLVEDRWQQAVILHINKALSSKEASDLCALVLTLLLYSLRGDLTILFLVAIRLSH